MALRWRRRVTVVRYAGEHLLELLGGRAGAGDRRVRSHEIDEINEKGGSAGDLSSSNSFISSSDMPSVQGEKHPALPKEVVEGLNLLRTMPAPRGFPAAQWSNAVRQAILFASNWGASALSLGWSPVELFGLHPIAPHARHDAKGLAFAQSDAAQIVAITETSAVLKTISGAELRFYRKLHPRDAVLAWLLDWSMSDLRG
jgi:hypothetical protein